MRLALLSLAAATTSGFAPSSWGSRQSTYLASSTVTEAHEATTKDDVDPIRELLKPAAINARLEAQLEKMKEKDKTSRALTKDVSAGTSTLVVPILEKMRQMRIILPWIWVRRKTSLSPFVSQHFGRDRSSRLSLRTSTSLLSTSLLVFFVFQGRVEGDPWFKPSTMLLVVKWTTWT
jgi:hypothetical protein